MRSSLKMFALLVALATTVTLTSCQADSVEPAPKPKTKQTEQVDNPVRVSDDEQPPKAGWPNV